VRERGIVSQVRGGVPSDRAVAPATEDFSKIAWGPPPVINDLTARHRLFSEARRKVVLRFDSRGRLIVGPNRL
jgi:hypothetical protein